MTVELIYDAVKVHMNEQPYAMDCAVCLKPLSFTTDVDSDCDITLTVTPCPRCLHNAVVEAGHEAD